MRGNEKAGSMELAVCMTILTNPDQLTPTSHGGRETALTVIVKDGLSDGMLVAEV